VTTASLTLTRSALAVPLADLVISGDHTQSLWLDESGFGRPQFTFRKGHAPESDIFPGQSLLTAVKDQAAIPCGIYARGASAAALDTAMTELETALAQFVFTVTLTVDGVAKSFEAECTAPAWGALDSGEVEAHLARASVVIPVNPPGA
jgi:hypothetical protein